jgi:hypothetical protein
MASATLAGQQGPPAAGAARAARDEAEPAPHRRRGHTHGDPALVDLGPAGRTAVERRAPMGLPATARRWSHADRAPAGGALRHAAAQAEPAWGPAALPARAAGHRRCHPSDSRHAHREPVRAVAAGNAAAAGTCVAQPLAHAAARAVEGRQIEGRPAAQTARTAAHRLAAPAVAARARPAVLADSDRLPRRRGRAAQAAAAAGDKRVRAAAAVASPVASPTAGQTAAALHAAAAKPVAGPADPDGCVGAAAGRRQALQDWSAVTSLKPSHPLPASRQGIRA